MFKKLKMLCGTTVLAALPLALVGVSTTAQAEAQQTQAEQQKVKVVYHINDSEEQALGALRNMRNHLNVAPDTLIKVVAHADGIDFLTNDYEENDTVGPLVADLTTRGVDFEVCEITMDRLGLGQEDFLLEAKFTPSGVARIAELQALDGYAYIKP